MRTSNPTAVAELLAARQVAARDLYDCECALHVAHQACVDEWITAAADRLHGALIRLRLVEEQLRTAIGCDRAA